MYRDIFRMNIHKYPLQVNIYIGTDFGARCVQLWIRSAEPPVEHPYENLNNNIIYRFEDWILFHTGNDQSNWLTFNAPKKADEICKISKNVLLKVYHISNSKTTMTSHNRIDQDCVADCEPPYLDLHHSQIQQFLVLIEIYKLPHAEIKII